MVYRHCLINIQIATCKTHMRILSEKKVMLLCCAVKKYYQFQTLLSKFEFAKEREVIDEMKLLKDCMIIHPIQLSFESGLVCFVEQIEYRYCC